MSQTLYRKYRSQTFAELIGQESVVRILRNAIRRERINHAYIFSGPRGTGKTSIARIFAKALNCLDPRDGDACGVCDVCTSIAAGNSVDVIEIDAASNRGIDDIRDLRERVGYAPLELRRKVYIIDEVHMITREGFNALLKTLEEPPGHVVFCLCTTESNKVPITILSRCVRFDFQRLPLNELAAHLVEIAKREGFNMELDSGLRLSMIAEGSARDAISLLDQLTVYCDGEIRPQDISELFQLGDPDLTAQVVDLLAEGKADEALAAWTELLNRGVDAGTFLLQLADAIKQRFLERSASGGTTGGWGLALEVVWQGLNLLKYDSFPALLVELTLLQTGDALAGGHHASAPPPTTARSTADEPRAARTEAQAQSGGLSPRQMVERQQSGETNQPPAASALTNPAPSRRPEPRIVSQTAPSNPPPRISAPVEAPTGPWGDFVAAVRRRKLTTYTVLVHGVSGELRDGELLIRFEPDQQFTLSIARKPENVEVLTAAAQEVYGPDTQLQLTLVGNEAAVPSQPAATPAAAPAAERTPAPAAVPDPSSANGVAGESTSDNTSQEKATGVTVEHFKELFDAEEI